MNAKKVGSFIKEQRQELGLSQKELAEKLYITDKAVSKWETGRGLPDISSLEPLSNALNVSVSEILNGEKSQNNESEIDNAKLLKKLKIKKYIRLAAEIVITIVYAYWLYIFKDTFKGFQNVLDLALQKPILQRLIITRRKNITKTRINITLAQAIIAKRQILTKDFMF